MEHTTTPTSCTNPSIPPPPLDDPTCTDPLVCPPLRWGIIGCGRVSHDFVQAVKHLPSATVVACATQDDPIRSNQFATRHGIQQAYSCYDDLICDTNVDIVYIGNVHAFRRTIVEKCIIANKNTLIEKPLACTLHDAEYLIQLARERNLFMLEGMWTRFFPAVEQARRLVCGTPLPQPAQPTTQQNDNDNDDDKNSKHNDQSNSGYDGVIGEVVMVSSDFNFNASDSESYPSSFVYQRKLGGGASLLVAPYPIAASTLFFKGAMPESIKVTGQIDKDTEVDLQAVIALSFPPTGTIAPAKDESIANESTPKLPGSGVAMLSYGMLGESEETTTIVGTKGRLTIQTPCHCPTNVSVRVKGQGRGNATKVTEYYYPLPPDTEAIQNAGGYYYPNSAGFCYEAAAVARCINSGKLECPQYTLSETLVQLKIIEAAREQLRLKTVYDD